MLFSVVFQFLEAGLIFARHAAAADFHRHLRRIAVQMRHQDVADDVIEQRVLVDHRLQPRAHRADDAIGQEHAQEGADQRRADHAAQHFRRFADRAHGLDDAQHGGDDAQRGQAVGHGCSALAPTRAS